MKKHILQLCAVPFSVLAFSQSSVPAQISSGESASLNTEKGILATNDGTLLISGSGSIKVFTGAVLKVTDAINTTSDPAQFLVESDANLIQVNDVENTGNITVERYVTDMDNDLQNQMDYVYWSAPVSGQGLQVFSPGTPASRIYEYNESNDYFRAVNLSTEPHFLPAKGYAIRAEISGTFPVNTDGIGYNKTYAFKGVPNNGEIPIAVKRSVNSGTVSNPVIHGYNMIGNPYPSHINVDSLFENNSGLIYATAWFWTNSSYQQVMSGSGYSGNNYAVYNATGGNNATTDANAQVPLPNGIVKVGQAFIVQVKTAPNTNGTLIFKNSYDGQDLRVTDDGNFYQKGNSGKNRYWLQLTSPTGLVNSQLIGYMPGATAGYDMDYDADAFSLSSDLFYSKLDDKRLVVQGKGPFDPTDKVSLGANFYGRGNYTVSLQDKEGIFAGGQTIYLKDKNTGIITNLSQGSYAFLAERGENNNRFEIIYQPEAVLATDDSAKEELVVYRDGDDFVVKAQQSRITGLEVYDASGRMIVRLIPNSTEAVISTERLGNGIYLLKIDQNGKITTKKVLR